MTVSDALAALDQLERATGEGCAGIVEALRAWLATERAE